MKREVLSETHAAHLRGMREAMVRGLRQGEAARKLGIAPSRLSSDLTFLTGSGKWPPAAEVIDALLALPVVSDAEYRSARSRANGQACAAKISASLKRAFRDGRQMRPQERAESSFEAEIVRRERDNRRAREAHERHWLEVERAKYRLPRAGRPLSRMPA